MFAANAVASSTPGQNWYAKTGPSRVYYCAAYGNGTYLFSGNQGYVATSTDANTWSDQLGLRTAGVTVAMYGATYAGSLGLFVVGGSNGNIATSPDGVTWTKRTNTTTAVLSILWNGTTLLAYCDSGRIYTSTNGTSWTFLNTMSSLAGWPANTGPFLSNCGAYGNGLFLLIGQVSGNPSKYCATSPDGVTWTDRPGYNSVATSTVATASAWSTATNRWYVGLADGTVVSSSDAATWSVVSGLSSIIGSSPVRAINSVGNTVVVFADSSKVATSTNGINWVSQTGLSAIGRSATACSQNGNILTVNGFAVSV